MKKRIIVVGMIGLMVLTGCTASLVNSLDPDKQRIKEAVEAAPSYAHTPEAKDIKVPETWRDEAMKKKVLFEGIMVQTPDGPAKRLRITYIPETRERDKYHDMFSVIIAEPKKNRLDARCDLLWLDWKNHPDDLKGIVRSFKEAKIPVGDTTVAGIALQKAPPSFVREIFMGDEPVFCRSLVEQKDIPLGVGNRLGMSIDNSNKINPVLGFLSVAAVALPMVGAVAAPAITGIGSILTTAGYGAAAVAGQTAIGVAGSLNEAGVLTDKSSGEPSELPACVSFKSKEQSK